MPISLCVFLHTVVCHSCFRVKNFKINHVHTTLPRRQILDSFKLKEFADDILDLMKMIERSQNTMENTVDKREIARRKRFLLFPQCFQKTCTVDT